MSMLRTMLFVPGDRPERFDKAVQTGADRVVIDLEDAVLPSGKIEAREAARAWGGVTESVVRINASGTPWFQADLGMVLEAGARGVMVPKAESIDVLELVCRSLGSGIEIYPLIETVAGVAEMRALASIPGVTRLVFGSADFALDSGIQDETGWRPVQTEMVLASRLAGLLPPIDGVILNWDDEAALRRKAEQSRRFGFGGRLCIHPKQIAPINEGMLPTQAELDWARRVVEAFADQDSGAVVVDGKMVDEPLRNLARRWLQGA